MDALQRVQSKLCMKKSICESSIKEKKQAANVSHKLEKLSLPAYNLTTSILTLNSVDM